MKVGIIVDLLAYSIPAGIVLIFVGALGLLYCTKKRLRCSKYVDATVVQAFESQKQVEDKNEASGFRIDTVYKPVLDYTVGGRKYSISGRETQTPCGIGHTMTVRYNPQNPGDSFLTGEFGNRAISGFLLALAVGIGLLLYGIFSIT